VTAASSPAEQTALWAARHAHTLTVQPRNKRWTRDIQDTRTQEEISVYYQGGIVRDYNTAGLVSKSREDNFDLQPFTRRLPVTEEELKQAEASKKADLDRHRKLFYAGRDNVFTSFHRRYHEIHEQARARELGLIHPSEGGPLTVAQMDAATDTSSLGKPRHMSIEFISSKMKPSEAARPLLGMTYAALYQGKKGLHGIPKPQAGGDWPVNEWGYVGQEKEANAKPEAQVNRVPSQTPAPRDRSIMRSDLSWRRP